MEGHCLRSQVGMGSDWPPPPSRWWFRRVGENYAPILSR